MTDATTPNSRSGRRTGRWIAVIVVVVVLLVAAVVAAEFIARSVVTSTVRSLVVTNVGLPDDQDVDVQVAGLVLPQVIAGRLDEVAVASDDVTLGPITGDVRVDLRGVPVSAGSAAEGGVASVRLDQEQLRTLLAQLPDLPAGTVEVAAPDVTFETTLTLFGIGIPVGVTATPGAAEGDLTITPTGFQVAGNAIDTDTLRGQFGGVADTLVQTRSLCIADRLPAGLTLTSATVQGQDLVATFDIAGAIISDPALQADGTCG
ncbi:LmeA family phospholipid-binding protein [Microbacterium sp. 22296]|uniref:LmeA family phospholipid-binding protein n=1 Tax=Microbacterium sp. 22296 TaxID=3453903 RepID=UPI003F83363B